MKLSQFYQLKAFSYFSVPILNNYIASSLIYTHCHYSSICFIHIDIHKCDRSPGTKCVPLCRKVLKSTGCVSDVLTNNGMAYCCILVHFEQQIFKQDF